MPIDPTLGLRIAIDSFWYNLLLNLAGLHWGLLRGFIMMGYIVEVINRWLAQNAFSPLIQMTNDTLEVAVGLAFVVALFVLGITYLLAAIIRLDVVSPRSAILWYIAGSLFFAVGPSLYQGMNDFRMTVAEGFYLSALNGLQGSVGGTFGSLSQVQSADLGIGAICDHLGVYLPGATGAGRIDGLDVALAYLRADGPDVMGYPQPFFSPGCPPHFFNPLTGAYVSPIPQEWYFPGSYFDVNQGAALSFDILTDAERAASIAVASSSQGRLLTAWPLVLFGVVEQLVFLLITIAQGLTFISFGVAILFAFFKRTEAIANSIVNQWIELIVQTVIIALIQALVVALFLAGTAAGNGMVVLGVGLICLVFMLITLWSGVKAVWNSFNRLFSAFSQAAGGTILTPAQAGGAAGTAGVMAAGGAVAIGSSSLAGMTAMDMGATRAQTAGLTLGSVTPLTSAARTLAYLPGVRNTALGEAAEQFLEGATTRRVAGPVLGMMLLSDRDPGAADYDDKGRMIGRPMLVPAVGEMLEGWTLPREAKRKPGAQPPEDDLFVDEAGDIVSTFTPSRPRRMGTFTPVAQPDDEATSRDRERQKSEYAAEMQGEEMEQHISDTLRANPTPNLGDGASASRLDQVATRLESGAEALATAARSQTLVGQLKVGGTDNVAGVLGDVLRGLKIEQPGATGIDNFALAERMARAMGVTPSGNSPVIQQDLARFGLFADQALRLGVNGSQAETVIREVKADGKLSDKTRTVLVEQVRSERGVSAATAEHEVAGLERAARLLPESITAFGVMNVPAVTVDVQPQINVQVNNEESDNSDAMRQAPALAGSGSVMGGQA
ncbi:MAG TPA: hypothetical protein PLQ56_16765 [Aggregatilineales bacterium]|nr:hypothetical protein [Aggregatilineales bacterium]